VDVVLDANVLCEDFLLSGKNFRIFWGEAPRIPARVFIPQVALDETINKYRERLEVYASESIKLARNVGLLLRRKVQPYLDASSVPKLAEAYKAQIQTKLTEVGAAVLPYPEVSHEEVVRRDLARSRPFRIGGAGYRDTLIWETVISLCHFHQAATVILVTRNERDFGPGHDVLGEMGAELAKKLIDPKRIRICCGLDDFNSTFIIPRLESLATLKEQLVAHGIEGFDAHDWLAKEISTIVGSEDLGPVCVGFDLYCGYVFIESVDHIRKFVVLDARRLTSGEVLMSASAELDLVIHVSASGSDWERSQEVRNFFPGGGFEEASAWIPSTVKVRFSLFVSPERGNVESAELDAIEGERGSIEINRVPRQDN
jgi:PIN domain